MNNTTSRTLNKRRTLWILTLLCASLLPVLGGSTAYARGLPARLQASPAAPPGSGLFQDEPPDIAPEGVEALSPIFFPLVFRDLSQQPVEYLPTTTALFCSSADQEIPDQASISSTIDVGDTRLVGDLDVRLDIAHDWVGDLIVSLTHQETGKIVSLVDRPGVPAIDQQGCGNDNLIAILDDEITSPLENKWRHPAISGFSSPISRWQLLTWSG
jgi:hypothetical protein